MATLRNKRKLAAVTRETQEENPRNGQSRNTSVPRINEEYITQVSEQIEGRVTKKLSQEFSRTESRTLGALSKLDEFLLNQQIRMHSGTVPETFRNTNLDNQGTNEDDSMSDPHPEAGLFRSQTTQNSGPEVGPYNGVWCTSQCSRLLMAPGSLSISFLATKMPVTWVAVSILIVTLSKKFNVALSSFVFFREHSISFSFLVLDNKSYAAFSAFILIVSICSFCFRWLWKVLITIWVTQLPLQHAKCSLDLYVVHFCCITRVSTCMAWVRTGCSVFFIGTCERTS